MARIETKKKEETIKRTEHRGPRIREKKAKRKNQQRKQPNRNSSLGWQEIKKVARNLPDTVPAEGDNDYKKLIHV